MTIRINQVSVDIRENLNPEVKDDQVSRKAELLIDNKMKKPFKNEENKKGGKEKKKYLTIDGIKNNKNIEIEAVIEKEDLGDNSTGIFIDSKK